MIHPLVAQHLPEIQALCREFGVSKLEAFSMPHTSGLDLLVAFTTGGNESGVRRLADMEERLATIVGGEVNLFTASALKNDWLRHEAWRTRSTLYEAPARYTYAS